jgi:hypothetical protein
VINHICVAIGQNTFYGNIVVAVAVPVSRVLNLSTDNNVERKKTS